MTEEQKRKIMCIDLGYPAPQTGDRLWSPKYGWVTVGGGPFTREIYDGYSINVWLDREQSLEEGGLIVAKCVLFNTSRGFLRKGHELCPPDPLCPPDAKETEEIKKVKLGHPPPNPGERIYSPEHGWATAEEYRYVRFLESETVMHQKSYQLNIRFDDKSVFLDSDEGIVFHTDNFLRKGHELCPPDPRDEDKKARLKSLLNLVNDIEKEQERFDEPVSASFTLMAKMTSELIKSDPGLNAIAEFGKKIIQERNSRNSLIREFFCPRCNNKREVFDNESFFGLVHPCTQCGYPGWKSLPNACRHHRLFVCQDGHAHCLICPAKFYFLGWFGKRGEVIKRCPDMSVMEEMFGTYFVQNNVLYSEFYAVSENSPSGIFPSNDKHARYSRPFVLRPLNDAAKPPYGWVEEE